MVLFFIILLCVSIFGITSIIMVKRSEMTTGRVFFADVRPAALRYLGGWLHFMERRAPTIVKRLGFALFLTVKRALHLCLAWAVLHAEALLERALYTLRGATEERGDGKASPFLREVAEHKKSLQDRSSKKPNAIYEE